MGALHRLTHSWQNRPLAMALLAALIPVGAVTLVLGANVSPPHFDDAITVRCVGALLALSGVLVTFSVLRGDFLYEILGLATAALATGTYGVSILVGLGLHGFLSAAGYLAMSSALAIRAAFLCRSAGIAASE